MQILNVTWKWTVPNALSLLRILLVPVFVVLYVSEGVSDIWAFGVLLLSGITDLLDGFIARRFNQITECGQLLDPVSDKLTQVAVAVALTTRYAELLPLAIICLVKEGSLAIGSVFMLRKGYTVKAAQWYGKLSTAVFYGCMLILVLWHDVLPFGITIGLMVAASLCMLLAFFGYLVIFIQQWVARRTKKLPEKG